MAKYIGVDIEISEPAALVCNIEYVAVVHDDLSIQLYLNHLDHQGLKKYDIGYLSTLHRQPVMRLY